MKYHIVCKKKQHFAHYFTGSLDECNTEFTKMSSKFGKSMVELLTNGGYRIVNHDKYSELALHHHSKDLHGAARDLYRACSTMNLSDEADQAMQRLFEIFKELGTV